MRNAYLADMRIHNPNARWRHSWCLYELSQDGLPRRCAEFHFESNHHDASARLEWSNALALPGIEMHYDEEALPGYMRDAALEGCECAIMATRNCRADGSSLAGERLLKRWQESGHDDTIIWDELKEWMERNDAE